jgi:6-phosphogluconolactonase
MKNVHVYKTPEEVAQAVADYLYQQITNCVTEKGICHVVLPGGTTPAHCIQLLAEKPLPWGIIHWYPGDERCYPVGHDERNDTMIINKLFAHNSSVKENFHPIPAELGPEQGAERYASLIDSVGVFDIVALGMGEDGHTASLFPGNKALEDTRSVVPVYNSPKPPDERVSIGLSALQQANNRIVIVTGKGKRDILKKALTEKTLPVSQIQADSWFVDEAAYGSK